MKNDQLEQVYISYHRELYIYSLSLCRNHHQAQDLSSETFYKALLSLDEEVPHIKYWLFRVCRNLFLDDARRSRKYQDGEHMDFVLDTGMTPLDTLVDNDERKQLYRQVLELRPSYRELIVLYYYCGFSLKEIAHTLEMTEGTARTILFRARKKLKSALEVRP